MSFSSSPFDKHRINAGVETLRQREKILLLVGVCAFYAVLVCIFIYLVLKLSGLLSIPYDKLSRVEVTASLFDLFNVVTPSTQATPPSATLYVRHTGTAGSILRNSMNIGLITIFLAGLFFFAFIQAKKTIMQYLFLFIAVPLFLAGFGFAAFTPLAIQKLADGGNEVVKGAETGERLLTIRRGELDYIDFRERLDGQDVAQSLGGKYLIAQVALRAEAVDSDAVVREFLSSYERNPEALGVVPVPQHMYALEMDAYGEPRSEVAKAYYQSRSNDGRSSGGVASTIIGWLAGFLMALSIISFALRNHITRRVNRVETLMRQ